EISVLQTYVYTNAKQVARYHTLVNTSFKVGIKRKLTGSTHAHHKIYRIRSRSWVLINTNRSPGAQAVEFVHRPHISALPVYRLIREGDVWWKYFRFEFLSMLYHYDSFHGINLRHKV